MRSTLLNGGDYGVEGGLMVTLLFLALVIALWIRRRKELLSPLSGINKT